MVTFGLCQLVMSHPGRCGTHNELDSISESGVEKAAEGLTQLDRDLLSCKGENGSQGNNGEEVERKDSRGTPFKNAG